MHGSPFARRGGIKRRRDQARGRPLPLGGGGPILLTSAASLEKRGEGVTAADSTPRLSALLSRVTPSPFASKLAALAKRRSPPPPRGRGPSRFRVLARGVS